MWRRWGGAGSESRLAAEAWRGVDLRQRPRRECHAAVPGEADEDTYADADRGCPAGEPLHDADGALRDFVGGAVPQHTVANSEHWGAAEESEGRVVTHAFVETHDDRVVP